MKKIATAFLVLLSTYVSAQNSQAISLRWKIAKDEQINYLTVMNDIDTSSISVDFGGLSKLLSDSSKKGMEESKNLFKSINQAFKNQDFISTLSYKEGGVINVVMTANPKKDNSNSDDKGNELMKLMMAQNQGVVLRGAVYATGGVQSFWVTNNQKNLVALLFELPSMPVKIGDKWPLAVNMIANDQSFDCDSSYKKNEVTLAGIKIANGETIAVLRYDIVEYVSGNFSGPPMPGNEDNRKETMMNMTIQGIAEFSVDKGRWKNYDGIMNFQATGVMKANKKTKLTLIDTSR